MTKAFILQMSKKERDEARKEVRSHIISNIVLLSFIASDICYLCYLLTEVGIQNCWIVFMHSLIAIVWYLFYTQTAVLAQLSHPNIVTYRESFEGECFVHWDRDVNIEGIHDTPVSKFYFRFFCALLSKKSYIPYSVLDFTSLWNIL